MPVHIIIIMTVGIASAVYLLISKIIEITAEKTAEKIIKKLDLAFLHK